MILFILVIVILLQIIFSNRNRIEKYSNNSSRMDSIFTPMKILNER